MIGNVPDGLYATLPDDADSTIFVSERVTEWTDRPASEFYDDSAAFARIIHPDDRDRIVLAASTKQAGGEYDEEYRIIKPDGTEHWINDKAFPIADKEGEVYRIVGVAEDITERKASERERVVQREKLQALAAELSRAEELDRRRIAAARRDDIGQTLPDSV